MAGLDCDSRLDRSHLPDFLPREDEPSSIEGIEAGDLSAQQSAMEDESKSANDNEFAVQSAVTIEKTSAPTSWKSRTPKNTEELGADAPPKSEIATVNGETSTQPESALGAQPSEQSQPALTTQPTKQTRKAGGSKRQKKERLP